MAEKDKDSWSPEILLLNYHRRMTDLGISLLAYQQDWESMT